MKTNELASLKKTTGAQAPAASAEGAPKPYAYEYGKDNGDGTYSVVIERGDLVKVSDTEYVYGAPKRTVAEWPVKPLYLEPRTDNAVAGSAGNQDDFSRGYYCAVAVLLREWGDVNTDVRSLFSQGGDPTKADLCDQELFREHGLMPAK